MCATVVDRMMPAPYSQDLRWRVVWFVWHLGLSVEEAAFYLGVSTWTVERYLTKFANTGGVTTKTLGRPTGKLKFSPYEELLVLEAILKNPDKTYSEIVNELYKATGSEFACSTLHHYLKRNGITRKQVGYSKSYSN